MWKLVFFLGVLAVFAACEPIEETPKFLEINGEQTSLSVGTIHDYGTNSEISYREYQLTFANSSSKPSDYIRFNIYSTNTERLQEETYTYAYWGDKGNISWLSLGQNIVYDNSGVAISGTRITESNYSCEGTVDVSMKDEVYKFVFDLTATSNDKTYTIKGEFNELLTEDYISIYTK